MLQRAKSQNPGVPVMARGRSLLWALGIFVVFAPLAVRVYRRKT